MDSDKWYVEVDIEETQTWPVSRYPHSICLVGLRKITKPPWGQLPSWLKVEPRIPQIQSISSNHSTPSNTFNWYRGNILYSVISFIFAEFDTYLGQQEIEEKQKVLKYCTVSLFNYFNSWFIFASLFCHINLNLFASSLSLLHNPLALNNDFFDVPLLKN
jgi:hypothetical protein